MLKQGYAPQYQVYAAKPPAGEKGSLRWGKIIVLSTLNNVLTNKSLRTAHDRLQYTPQGDDWSRQGRMSQVASRAAQSR